MRKVIITKSFLKASMLTYIVCGMTTILERIPKAVRSTAKDAFLFLENVELGSQ